MVNVRRGVLVVAERRAGDIDAVPDAAAVGALEAAELHAEAGEVGVVREPRAEVGAVARALRALQLAAEARREGTLFRLLFAAIGRSRR